MSDNTDEIRQFIRRTHAKIREQAEALADPEQDPVGALDLAIAAWQLVKALCDSQQLGLVAENGVVCGLAKIEIAPELAAQGSRSEETLGTLVTDRSIEGQLNPDGNPENTELAAQENNTPEESTPEEL